MTNIVDLPKQSLAITVWDHNKSKQNDYIGKIITIINDYVGENHLMKVFGRYVFLKKILFPTDILHIRADFYI